MIGFEWTTSEQRRKQLVAQRVSFELQAWELALAAGVWFAGQWILALPAPSKRLFELKAKAKADAERVANALGLSANEIERQGRAAEASAGTLLGDIISTVKRLFPDLGGPIGHPLGRVGGWP